MNESTGSTVPAPASESLASRLLHTVLFGAVFWLLCWAVAITAIVQIGLRVFTAAPNPELQRFGAGLGRYAAQVIAYLCFARETLPFPFSDWPEVPTRLSEDDISGL